MNKHKLLSMNEVKKVQLAWAILLLLSKGRILRTIMHSSLPEATTQICIIVAIAVYVFAASVCFSNNRLAWWTVIIIPATLLYWYVYNIGWFFYYNYVYDNSMTTGMRLTINRYLYFMIPMICMFFLLYENRTELKGILFPNWKPAVADDASE